MKAIRGAVERMRREHGVMILTYSSIPALKKAADKKVFNYST